MVREDIIKNYLKTQDLHGARKFLDFAYAEGCTVEITVRVKDFTADEIFHIYRGTEELYLLNYKTNEFKYSEKGRWHEFHLTKHEAYALRAYIICLMRGDVAPAFWPQISRNIKRRGDVLKNLSEKLLIVLEDEI